MRSQRTNLSFLRWLIRVSLFIFILALGTVATLVVGEVQSLASADLSHAPIRAMTSPAGSESLYASLADDSRRGVYRSDDDGRTWQQVSSGPEASLTTLVVHPANKEVLYAGAPGGPVATTNNLWRSNDGGQTWHKFFLSLPGNVDSLIPAVTSLAVDPQQPESLYVGTAGQGVYRFNVGNDGYGYELVGGVSFHDADVSQVVVGPDSRIYALTPQGIFTSKGDDEAWRKLETLPEYAVSLAVAPTNAKTIYAGGTSSGAYRSLDEGGTWENIADGLGLVPGAALRVTALTVDKADSEHVAAATAYGLGKQLTGGGIYESADGGRNWTKQGDVDNLVTELTFGRDGTIHVVTEGGLVKHGTPSTPAAPFGLDALTQLNALQISILTLTTGLAGLALVGQKKWG